MNEIQKIIEKIKKQNIYISIYDAAFPSKDVKIDLMISYPRIRHIRKTFKNYKQTEMFLKGFMSCYDNLIK